MCVFCCISDGTQRGRVTKPVFDDYLRLPAYLNQTTMILGFAPVVTQSASGAGSSLKCPELALAPDGNPYDPFDPGAIVKGVTAVFKRLFFPYCEMQILFDQSGQTHFDAYVNSGRNPDSLPWSTVLALTNLLLAEKSDDVASLRARIRPRPELEPTRETAGEVPDAALFQIVIGRASPSSFVLRQPDTVDVSIVHLHYVVLPV
eukprot:COSAG01_NODE_3061_length_6652_cov_18.411567_5_plen_204_part_00